MEILNIIQCTNLGGMERSNLDRLEALIEKGHTCHLVSLNTYGDLLTLLERSSVSHEDLDYAKHKIATFFKLCQLIRSGTYDAIICTGHNLLTALALPFRNRHRHVLCIHFHHTGVKPPLFWKIYYRLALLKFAHVFFNSAFTREEAITLVPALTQSSSVLPNIYAMSASPITPADRLQARDKLGLPRDATIVANAGWLIPRKRFDVFLKTAGILIKEVPNVQFIIAGDGSERGRLVELARMEGVETQVHWLGWIKDIDCVYAASDVVLFNTDWDAVARTPIEAGVHGVNVVCSEVNGGLRDLFGDPSWIIPRHEPRELADLLQYYLGSPQASKEQIIEIRHNIRVKCSPDAHVRQLLHALGNI